MLTADRHSLFWAALPPPQHCPSQPTRASQPPENIPHRLAEKWCAGAGQRGRAHWKSVSNSAASCELGGVFFRPAAPRSARRRCYRLRADRRCAAAFRAGRGRKSGLCRNIQGPTGGFGHTGPQGFTHPVDSRPQGQARRLQTWFQRPQFHGESIAYGRAVRLTDVAASDLSPPDAAAAFTAGQIDAWAIWDPYFAVAEKRPEARVLATAEGHRRIMVVFSQQWRLYRCAWRCADGCPR